MATTEELLQELINLKKEEMHRTRNYRLGKFLMVTLPLILIFIASIWLSYALYQGLNEAIQNNPTLLDLMGSY